MKTLQNKIDFAVILRVKNANPNGDPLNGNRPRIDYNGFGEITDVCVKRKMRDRLMELTDAAGKELFEVFIQPDDRKRDGARSLRKRAESERWGIGKAAFVFNTENKSKTDESSSIDRELDAKAATIQRACRKWIDVRSFGCLFAWDGGKNGDSSVSISIRGPVTVQSAFSLEPVDVVSTQITKSVSSDGDGSRRGSDTMGMKYRVDQAVYVFYGSMNPQLAVKTGFSDSDAEAIKRILPKLFENDASSNRPEGSMEVLKVFWWKHNSKSGQYSSAKVHRSLRPLTDGNYVLLPLEGLAVEEIDGY